MTCPIWRSLGSTPELTASIAAGVVPYLLARVQKVSPTPIVTLSVLVAIVLLRTNATTKSQHAARAKGIPAKWRILARIENVKLKGC